MTNVITFVIMNCWVQSIIKIANNLFFAFLEIQMSKLATCLYKNYFFQKENITTGITNQKKKTNQSNSKYDIISLAFAVYRLE